MVLGIDGIAVRLRVLGLCVVEDGVVDPDLFVVPEALCGLLVCVSDASNVAYKVFPFISLSKAT